ncbi:MAG: Mur ligase family protein [Candidatus Dormibacteraeota bacterium]|nr:Mur ligase family protein [Candidatus Dormibacteraeota bacterium]
MEHTESRATAPSLTFEEALDYITGQGRFGIKLGLERMHALLAELGHPERGRRGVHIAGTNGKGSTSAFLEAILRARGLHVGMMPSPHLSSYTERVRYDGRRISEADFAAAVTELRPRLKRVRQQLGQPTEFEILTALAVDWLAPRSDRLVIEVGMGGRLDSTNVLDLGVDVVTNVSLDHVGHLGDTVARIAEEKAGIVKPGSVVITGATGEALSVVERTAAAVNAAALWRLGRELQVESRSLGWEGSEVDLEGPGFSHRGLRLQMLGDFQVANAALAVAAAHALGDATEAAVQEGVEAACWPGRLELCGDRLLLDGAHNEAGVRSLAGSLRSLIGDARLVLEFGAMADKDVDAMLAELRRLEPAFVVFTAAASAGVRAAPPEQLASRWGSDAEVRQDPHEALARARQLAGPEGWVVVCGSLYLVGELRRGSG